MVLGAGKSRSRLDAGLQMAFILLCPAHGEEEKEEKGDKGRGKEERGGEGRRGEGREGEEMQIHFHLLHTLTIPQASTLVF